MCTHLDACVGMNALKSLAQATSPYAIICEEPAWFWASPLPVTLAFASDLPESETQETNAEMQLVHVISWARGSSGRYLNWNGREGDSRPSLTRTCTG